MGRVIVAMFLLILCGCQGLTRKDSAPEITEGYIQLQQDRLYYKSLGKGETIIVLHGGPGMGSAYLEPTLSELATHYRVIFYDQRGSGASWAQELTPEWVQLDQYVEDLESLRLALNIPKIILLSHSWGALLAAQYAQKYPQNVQKFIMLSPSPFHHRGIQEMKENLAPRLITLEPHLKAVRESSAYLAYEPQAVERYARELFKAYTFDLEKVEAIPFRWTRNSARAYLEIVKIFEERLLTKDFNMLKEPASLVRTKTIVIHGDHDPTPERVVRILVDAIPSASLILLPECGHFPHIERPDECIEALYDALQTPNRPPKRIRKPVPSTQRKGEDEEQGLDKLLKTIITGLPKEKWDEVFKRKPENSEKP